jgi:hypothetical protein
MPINSRDDRRRRVLNEELVSGSIEAEDAPEPSPAATNTARPARRYRETALVDSQPRLTELLPRRLVTLAFFLAAGLLAVAGLESLYFYMPAWAEHTTDGRIEAFDLDGEGSLAVWFSSVTLLAAAAVAAVIYRVRRQRTDDYTGRYRVWPWAALCCLVMSLDETASLHEGFKELMSHATGTRLVGDGSLWWVLAYGLVLGLLGACVLLEVRDSKATVSFLALTAAAWGVAIVAQLGWLLPESGARGVMVEEGCEMVGNLLLVMALAVYARHVILEAEGKAVPAQRVTRRRKRLARRTEQEPAARPATKPATIPAPPVPAREASPAVLAGVRTGALFGSRTAAAPAVAQPTARPVVGASSGLRVDRPHAATGHGDHARHLSKAERKALRRAMRTERDE